MEEKVIFPPFSYHLKNSGHIIIIFFFFRNEGQIFKR
jgi:hypothetical protein